MLFREIRQQYPHIILEKKTLTRHVASIEKLKGDAGIHTLHEDLSKEYREQLNNIFPQVLIGLSVQELEFESINFEALIQRAHTLYHHLKIDRKNVRSLIRKVGLTLSLIYF